MKFNVFELCNNKTKKRVQCAIITTENDFILITTFEGRTKIREYKNKKNLVNDLMLIKSKTRSSIIN